MGDIGLMGAPAKKDGKACEGFKIFTGGKVGENPELAKDFAQVCGGWGGGGEELLAQVRCAREEPAWLDSICSSPAPYHA